MRLEKLREHLQQIGIPLYAVSAATGDGLPLLLEAAWKQLVEHKAAMTEDGAAARRGLGDGGRIEGR